MIPDPEYKIRSALRGFFCFHKNGELSPKLYINHVKDDISRDAARCLVRYNRDTGREGFAAVCRKPKKV